MRQGIIVLGPRMRVGKVTGDERGFKLWAGECCLVHLRAASIRERDEWVGCIEQILSKLTQDDAEHTHGGVLDELRARRGANDQRTPVHKVNPLWVSRAVKHREDEEQEDSAPPIPYALAWEASFNPKSKGAELLRQTLEVDEIPPAGASEHGRQLLRGLQSNQQSKN